MVIITKKIETYVSLRKENCSSGSCPFLQGTIMSPKKRSSNCIGEKLKPFFPWETIMSLGKRNLSCPREKLKPFFPWETIMSLGKRNLSCPREKLKPFFPWETIMYLGKRKLSCPKKQLKPLSPPKTWLLSRQLMFVPSRTCCSPRNNLSQFSP